MQMDAQLQALLDDLQSVKQSQECLYNHAYNLTKLAGSIHHMARNQDQRIRRFEDRLRTHLDMPYKKQFLKDPNS